MYRGRDYVGPRGDLGIRETSSERALCGVGEPPPRLRRLQRAAGGCDDESEDGEIPGRAVRHIAYCFAPCDSNAGHEAPLQTRVELELARANSIPRERFRTRTYPVGVRGNDGGSHSNQFRPRASLRGSRAEDVLNEEGTRREVGRG